MTKRYDVCAPRAGKDDKTFWHRVGTAFEGEKGIGIIFDSLPLPDKEGKVTVRLFEPREKQQRERPDDIKPPMGNGPRAPSQISTKYDPDDIPFAPEWR